MSLRSFQWLCIMSKSTVHNFCVDRQITLTFQVLYSTWFKSRFQLHSFLLLLSRMLLPNRFQVATLSLSSTSRVSRGPRLPHNCEYIHPCQFLYGIWFFDSSEFGDGVLKQWIYFILVSFYTASDSLTVVVHSPSTLTTLIINHYPHRQCQWVYVQWPFSLHKFIDIRDYSN